MFAVVRYGNQQYKVKPNQKIKIDKIEVKEGSNFKTPEVLLLNDTELEIGKPFIEGYVCEAKVIKHARAEKVIVFKKKSKKRYERTRGHRQDYTEIQIIQISKEGAKKATKEASAKTEEAPKASKEETPKAKTVKKAAPKAEENLDKVKI